MDHVDIFQEKTLNLKVVLDNFFRSGVDIRLENILLQETSNGISMAKLGFK